LYLQGILRCHWAAVGLRLQLWGLVESCRAPA
jgi:hypothetical protein